MAHGPEAHAGEAHAHAEQAFIWKYVFSKNHRIIGIQYYVTAMVMALVAGILAMLIRLQLAWPAKDYGFLAKIFPMGYDAGGGVGVMRPQFYPVLFTMHRTIMVFFVLSTGPGTGFCDLLI